MCSSPTATAGKATISCTSAISRFWRVTGSRSSRRAAHARCSSIARVKSIARPAETGGVEVRFSQAIGRDVAAFLTTLGKNRVAAAPLAFVPFALVEAATMPIEDGTALLDACLMYKNPGGDRSRAQSRANGRRCVRDLPSSRARRPQAIRSRGGKRNRGCARTALPTTSMLIGSGGTDIRSVTPPSNRKLAKGDNVITELTPAIEGYFAQICRTLVVGKAERRAEARDGHLYRSARGRYCGREAPACWPRMWRAPRTTCSVNTIWANT